ncbi:MAG: hypothetical protein AB1782_02035 [Cyanobacteriota bacterium]
MSLSYFYKLVIKYKKYIFVCTLLTIIVAEIFTVFQQPEYKAITTWLVEKIEFETAVAPQSRQDRNLNNSEPPKIYTARYSMPSTYLEAEILNSEKVATKLHELSKIPYGYYKFRENFIVIGDNKPYLTIRFFSNSLKEIETVLEESKGLFFKSLQSPKVNYHEENISALEDLVQETKEEYFSVKSRLKNAEKEHNTVNPILTGTLHQQNIKYYENIMLDIDEQLSALEASYNNDLKQLKVSSLQEAIERSEIGSNPSILETIAVLNKENVNLINLKSKYTDDHHEVKFTKERINELNEALRTYYSTLLGREISDNNLKKLIPFTPLQQSITANLLKMQLEINSLKGKKAIYDKLLESEAAQLNRAADFKYELLLLKGLSDFTESKLHLLLNFLLSENINLGLSQNDYLYHELKEPFVMQIKPNYLANFFYALVFGLLVSIYTVMIIEKINPKINDIEYVNNLGINYLATISNSKDLIYSKYQKDINIKEYQSAKLALSHIKTVQQVKSFSITPTTKDNSHSIILTNLAYSFANSGFKTIIIDLDINNPQINNLFSIKDKSANLVSYFEDNQILLNDIILKSQDTANLDIVITEKPKKLSKEFIFGSKKLIHFIDFIYDNYDYIFINLSNIEDIKLFNHIDFNLLLIKVNETEKTQLSEILKLANLHNIKIDHYIIDDSVDIKL